VDRRGDVAMCVRGDMARGEERRGEKGCEGKRERGRKWRISR
jgi:hypothetical protein